MADSFSAYQVRFESQWLPGTGVLSSVMPQAWQGAMRWVDVFADVCCDIAGQGPAAWSAG